MILCCCCCGCYSRNFTSIKVYKVKYIICYYKTWDLYFFVFILMTYILCNQYSVFRYLIEMMYKMWLVDTSILFRILLLSTPCGPITNFWEKWLVRTCKKVGFFPEISTLSYFALSFYNLQFFKPPQADSHKELTILIMCMLHLYLRGLCRKKSSLKKWVPWMKK